MKKQQWKLDAERDGHKWDDLSIFDQLRYQRRYPMGCMWLTIPLIIRAYPDHDRLDSAPCKKSHAIWEDKPLVQLSLFADDNTTPRPGAESRE